MIGMQKSDMVPPAPVPTKVSAYRLQLSPKDKVIMHVATPCGVISVFMDLEATRSLGEALVKIAAENLIVTPDIMVGPPPNPRKQ
jgi:hypothetical protein